MGNSAADVLILSAGRRVELIQAFKAELMALSPGARVLATEMKPDMSAACQVADAAFHVPRVTDPSYHDVLLDLCRREGIGLVVPTIDTELAGLALNREQFAAEGIHLVISDASLVSACRDKRATARLFAEIGIDSPRIFDRDALEFPCFAKPYDGSRSVGAVRLATSDRVTPDILSDPKMMFMEFIDGTHHEYTVDVYYDRHGVMKCIVPRQRLEVRDGEVSKGATRRGHVLEFLRERLSRLSGARGCLTVQLFAKPDGSRYAGLEINPRFGGGFPLTYAAGANYPGWLISEYLLDREIADFDAWHADLLMLRYDAKVLIHDRA
jgi:carbamoyl-phosphate synthase large subunit